MEGLSASRILFVGLCLWTCAVSTGESVASEQFDALGAVSRDRGSPEPALDSSDRAGRRRRADQRRRTHLPDKTPAQLKEERAAKLARDAKVALLARKVAMNKAKAAEDLKRRTAAVKWERAKDGILEEMKAIKTRHSKLKAELQINSRNMLTADTENAKNEASEHTQELKFKKNKQMRATLAEAEKNVAEALRFIKMVVSGRGDEAFRKSFLFAEMQNDMGAGPGGLMHLSDDQMNIPLFKVLNAALLKAKKATTYPNMLEAQKLLDQAEAKTNRDELKFKREKALRESAVEGLKKDALKRQEDRRLAAQKALLKAGEMEVQTKENSRKARVAQLDAKTAALQTQARALEEQSLIALEKSPRSEELAESNDAHNESIKAKERNSKKLIEQAVGKYNKMLKAAGKP